MNARLPRALPFLDDRHSAMLADMGVVPWWAPRAWLPWPPGHAARVQPLGRRPPDANALEADFPGPAGTGHTAGEPRRAPPPPSDAAPAAEATAVATRSAGGTRPGVAGSTPATPPERTDDIAAPSLANAPGQRIATLDWDALQEAIRTCQRCTLARCRTQAVPGVGDRQPDWLIVGEAPGEEEDRQGEPFVGRAGQLLDRMLAALGRQRGQGVYIANVLKCRPPRNRNPEPDEIARCAPYLLRQIALLRPRLIVAMGRFAAHTLLAEGGCDSPEALLRTPLGRLRGQVHRGHFAAGPTLVEIPIVVTYHPAYLLRNPVDKGKAWADLVLAQEALRQQPAQV
ncbi:uracil-DNA glycosylase [Tepidimonas charontis]|uniref:Type-4 uracil-DNA glycosylase n=1 Tax=Tepidimonas charontis TaxID=2267262 RepID=A0A554XB76_9BURK|nr:uracil-DNA glycosylase [Tepidimonas charontis]TSE33093.1 uracil-DNA glycosylase, family 4 [Tepidimonas charontis]